MRNDLSVLGRLVETPGQAGGPDNDLGSVDLIYDPGPGDANNDGKFDRFDLIQVSIAAKYESGEPATWSEGDWNGDGFFNRLDFVVALLPGHYDIDVEELRNRIDSGEASECLTTSFAAVAPNCVEVVVILQGNRFEPALIHESALGAVAVSVTSFRVRQREPAGQSGQFPLLPRPDHQLRMVGQRAVSQQPHLRSFDRLFQGETGIRSWVAADKATA